MSSIRQLHPGDELILERFLLAHLDSSMFLLGNLRTAGLVDTGKRYSGTYVAAFEHDEIVGVVAHYWKDNLICQTPTHIDALWREAVKLSGRPVAGILGLADQVDQVSQSLGITPDQCKLDGREVLFTLDLADLIIPTPLQQGDYVGRRISADDLDQLTVWRAAYVQETLGEPDSPALLAETRSTMERSLRERNTWVLDVDGQRFAMTSFNARINEAVQVGGVYTPPALRGRGYARAVVAASLRDARAEGVARAILFTGHDHVAAQKAYHAVGFQAVADWGLVLLKQPVTVK